MSQQGTKSLYHRGISKTTAAWVTSIVFAAAASGLLPISQTSNGTISTLPVAAAQDFGQRVIHGKVVDDRSAPVSGATVFLKNVKTRNVKSFTSITDGTFRFAQVGMVDDYEVWAEQGRAKSPVKSISSFDSRKDVEFDLKLK